MAVAEVSLRDARDRRLPLVSVRSGRPADGYAEAGREPYVVRVPLTQDEFDRVQLLHRRRRSAIRGGVACVALGVAMARFPAMLPLGAVIGVLSAALWIAATLMLRRMLPQVEPAGPPGTVRLRGVHRGFVSALAGAD